MLKLLKKNEKILLYNPSSKLGNTVLLNVRGLSPSRLSEELNKYQIYTRSGLHCSPLAHKTVKSNYEGAVRASIGAFNTSYDISCFVDALEEIIQYEKK